MDLREPDIKDIDAVEHMIRNCAAEADGFGIDEFKPDGHFNHRLMHEPKVLIAVDTENNILGAVLYGYSNLSRVPGSIYSAYFIVKKEQKRKGIGTLLLNAVCDVSENIGCDTLVFDVYINNQTAITWLTLFSRPKNNPVNVDVGYFWTPNSMQYTENLTREIQILVPVWCQLSPEVSKMVSYMKICQKL